MKNKNKKLNNPNELAERLLDFAVESVKFINMLPRTMFSRYVIGQFVRCSTSPGANYEEACGGESRADFVHKMGIVLKELKESRFWLRLVKRSNIIKIEKLDFLLEECSQLCAIVAKSIITAKNNKRKI